MSAKSLSQSNQDFWEGKAADYDAKPWQKQFIKQVTEEIISRLDWLGLGKDKPKKMIKMLDYACGPGIVSLALKPHVTRTLGIDISPAMVTEFNTRVQALGVSSEEMFAVQGNLLLNDEKDGEINPVLKEADWFDFDIAIVNAGYHHFEDPDLAAKRLVERLKPGSGIIVVVDFLEHGGWNPQRKAGSGDGGHAKVAHGHLNSHGHHGYHHHDHADTFTGKPNRDDSSSTIAHHGFSVERITACFESAGCVDVGVQVFEEPVKFGEGEQQMDCKVFIAKGTRPAG